MPEKRKNRYYFKGYVDFGSEVKVKSDISSRPLRHVYVVYDYKTKKTMGISESECLYLLEKELKTDSEYPKEVWKKIHKRLKHLNKAHCMMVIDLITSVGGNSFLNSLVSQLAHGSNLTKPQIQALNNIRKRGN